MKLVVVIAVIIIFLLGLISARNLILYETNFDNFNNLNNKKSIANSYERDYEKNSLEVQNVKLIVNKRGNYELIPSVLKKDVPVKMEVDLNSVLGCARSVVIPQFNVFKNVRQGDNIIEFIPTKEGKIRIQCSMNMYVGYFEVSSSVNKENDLSVEQASSIENKINTNSNINSNSNINTYNQNINFDNNIEKKQAIGCGCGCGGSI